VPFDAINVEAEPAAMEDLQRFGVPRVPAVVMGERVVHGWNPRELAALVGVEYVEPDHLSVEELQQRLDTILAATQRAIRQVPAERLTMKAPGRDRTVRQLGFHMFRLGLAFCEGMEQRRYSESWIAEEAPPEIFSGAAIIQYGQMVRENLQEWFQQPGWCDGMVNTYYGSQTGYELLERTVWHIAQHIRQLYALLDLMGITPDDPLTEADWKGLPLPKEVW
jgi:hypothetical protein